MRGRDIRKCLYTLGRKTVPTDRKKSGATKLERCGSKNTFKVAGRRNFAASTAAHGRERLAESENWY